MVSPTDPLSLFDPVVARWFTERVGKPTEVQQLAWPVIAAGEHALVTAPTGSGKTLAAFLWALDRLLSRDWEGGGIRVLYVSPFGPWVTTYAAIYWPHSPSSRPC